MFRAVLTGMFLAGLFGVAGPAQAASGDVSDWVRARADAYEAYLRGKGPPVPGQLWHERPGAEQVAPNFTGPVSLAPLIRAVSASVVNISALVPAPPEGAAGTAHRLLGSGFVISADGFVITNNHVVENADEISVHLADGREFPASAIGRDASTDVALLKLQAQEKDLPYAYLGDSDRMQVGDWVVAIGNPFKLDHSVSHGMISAKERVLGIGVFDDFIQTDASINPGNSGGPLFNMRGEVIGVNTAIITQAQGIGFAVPINMVKDLLPNLSVNGRLERGWIGVNIQDIGDTEHRGAVVTDVYENGPAAEAGVQQGDRVIAVNGKAVLSYLELLRRLSILAPGTEAKLTLMREGAAHEVTVKLVERPAPHPIQSIQMGESGPLGLVCRDLTPDVAAGAGLSAHLEGVLVASVLPGSPAERSGIRAGDVVVELNRMPVRDLKSYRDALEALGTADVALVRYQRGDVIRYVAVRLD